MTRLIEIATHAGPDAFVVQRFEGQEAIGELFCYQLALLSEQPDIAPASLLGTLATVSMELGGGQPARLYNGYVTRFDALGPCRTPAFGGGVGARYAVTLRPGLWLRTLAADCRVHGPARLGDLVADEIARDRTMAVSNRLGQTEHRDYVVQYAETDFDFIRRLCEHAGITWLFEHAADGHGCVLIDDTTARTVNPLAPVLRFGGASAQRGQSVALERHGALGSAAVCVADYNYLLPQQQIAAAADVPQPAAGRGEQFEWPAGTSTTAYAASYAQARAEAAAVALEGIRGAVAERGLQVGLLTAIEGHPVASMNGTFLVIAQSFTAHNNLSSTSADGPADFACEFQAIPSTTPFRAARRTPRPIIPGVQTARVVAHFRADTHPTPGPDPTGADLARVRVVFPWERRGAASCWARVSQPWAGAGCGFQNMPRIGEEVVVQFVDGDPDRPMVTGRVWNADLRPPFGLPVHAAMTGLRTQTLDERGVGRPGAFNEFSLDDRAGAEQVYLQAQRDFDSRVLNDAVSWVGHERHAVVGGSVFERCDAAHHLDVKGHRNVRIGGDDSLAIAGDLLADIGQAAVVHASGEIQVSTVGTVVVESASRIVLKVGESFVDIGASGIVLNGPAVDVTSGGTTEAARRRAPRAPDAARAAITAVGAASAGDSGAISAAANR